jgi:hypothetical protein
MTNPTSNFGWQMPTSTDLVTDLPADFEVFGQAVDTSLADLKGGTTGQVLKKNTNADMDFVWGADSAGMTNPMTTTGDIIYSSSGSTPARLGIGTTGQVLNVAGGVPAWATAAAPTTNWTLINSGGTALSGSSTVTVSGISGYNNLFVLVQSANVSNNIVGIRFNADSGSNYLAYGSRISSPSSYNANMISSDPTSAVTTRDQIYIGQTGTFNGSAVYGGLTLSGALSTTGPKVIQSTGAAWGTNGQESYSLQGIWNNNAAVTSVSILSGTFSAGRIYVYGA